MEPKKHKIKKNQQTDGYKRDERPEIKKNLKRKK